ncbi:hypothetical protein LSH36_438g01005 [Paralvinella palmiformis]|uniref:Uncharacterized protein n=1 Tax=Paralvinella palmiformis TaxID=53620 RepID=A0AAD9JBF1_9ANNE|nr:hypothetical protein LSH36_438g01005 [Paralvinella palmiformis]
MQELASERERRWKAEEAARRLVDHIKQLETKAREEENLQDTAVLATTRLKQAIDQRERGFHQATFGSGWAEGVSGGGFYLNHNLVPSAVIIPGASVLWSHEEVRRLASQLEESKKSEDELQQALRVTQETAVGFEKEQLRKQAHEAKRLQDATMKAAASSREVEILQNNVRSLKGQIQQLQELLAAREQEHRKELEDRHRLGSPQLQELIQNETRSMEQMYHKKMEEQNDKYNQLSREYGDLEDEFRLALQIETNRFQELQTAFEKVSQELSQTKQMLSSIEHKEEKSTTLISELTSLVKEQKGRLSELSKAKQEQHHDYKERVQNLESHLEEARRRMVTLELLKQEKVKLQSQVQAQQSLIEGFRAEKKLWGDELAHQGSSLAQDRGRMEVKIEALSSEVATIKKQLQHETDIVRIKSKMIEDQTETIRKLKEAVQERDNEIRKAREETLKIQRELEDQLSGELMANQELQEKLDHARERKEQLKSEIVRIEDDLEESKRAHSVVGYKRLASGFKCKLRDLNKKWKEKSSLIAQLEQQVMAMKESWENKEKRLIEERDKAVRAASMAVEKLRSVDDAFRKQLDNKEESYQREIETLRSEKQEEIDLANKRVVEVEEEMRLLLRETESNKRLMEEKVKRLTKAFTELQQDVF